MMSPNTRPRVKVKMANIYNNDLSRELIDGAKIQIARDKIPSQLAEKVVPVMEVNPKLLKAVNVIVGNSKNTTGSLALYTTPANKDFYLTHVNVTYEKNAACDNTEMAVIVPINQQSVALLSIQTITLTASGGMLSIPLTTPIKLDKTGTITFTGTFAAGVLTRGLAIMGYTAEA